jgi:dihydrofolate reductase
MIKIIVAMSKNRAIGNSNRLIWKLSADLKRFKEMTTGAAVVMGRKTYESIGKPLPNRRNIVVTANSEYAADGCEIFGSFDRALESCGHDCFVIGGAEIYRQAMAFADRIYLTLVHEELEGDAFFPEIGKDWVKISREDFCADNKNEYAYSFIEYERYSF